MSSLDNIKIEDSNLLKESLESSSQDEEINEK